MKALRIFALSVLASGLMLTSCNKESVSPSSTTLEVKIRATNKSFSLLKAASVAVPGFGWDTCYMSVSKIEFEAERRGSEMSHDSSEIHIEWTGPKRVDLFALNSLVGNISLQSGVYSEISIKIKALKADAGATPVFYLSGTDTNNSGTVIPIVLIVNEDFTIKVEKEGSQIDATADYTSLVNLNLSLLMSGILTSDLDGATLTNGKIIISSTSNVALYSKINTNLSSCIESELEHMHGSDDSGHGSNPGNGTGNSGGYY